MSKGVLVSDTTRDKHRSITKTFLRCGCGAESNPYIEVNPMVATEWGKGMARAMAEGAGWGSTLDGRITRPVCPGCREEA